MGGVIVLIWRRRWRVSEKGESGRSIGRYLAERGASGKGGSIVKPDPQSRTDQGPMA
jgi:hypothetical protein